MFFVNKNPAGKAYNVLFGVAELVDGVVRIITLGVVASKLTVTVSRKQAQKAIERAKAARKA